MWTRLTRPTNGTNRGQAIEFPRKGAADAVYRIAGVVGDTKHNDLREPSPRFVFIPIQQSLVAYGRFTLTVAAAPGGQTALLRSRLGAVPCRIVSFRGDHDQAAA
ncbi:MAG: hypothetical protein HY820_27120 [Acidobacteria bacterium]|nr:hypothetical protein [Acidobacteriota bacterium]